jgi:hypothetical protein
LFFAPFKHSPGFPIDVSGKGIEGQLDCELCATAVRKIVNE